MATRFEAAGSDVNFYKRFPGDYGRDTGHLTLIEHGAYTVLLDHYYSTGRPLPAALETLDRICRAVTKAEQTAVRSVADQFFAIAADGLRHNGRSDQEIAKWETVAELNRSKGKLGGRPPKNPPDNPTGSDPANPNETQRVSRTEPERNPIQNPEPDTRIKDSGLRSSTAVALEHRNIARGAVERVFEHWQNAHNHPRAVLDSKRRKLIRDRLRDYSEADLCQSITGYLNSPHHMGQNDRATKYDSIELLLRDAARIDAGLKFYSEPPRTDLSNLTRKNIAATEGWSPPEMRNARN